MSDDLFKDTQLGDSQQSDSCIYIVILDHLIANSEVISSDNTSHEISAAGIDSYYFMTILDTSIHVLSEDKERKLTELMEEDRTNLEYVSGIFRARGFCEYEGS